MGGETQLSFFPFFGAAVSGLIMEDLICYRSRK